MTATIIGTNGTGALGGGASLTQRAMLVDFTARRWSAKRAEKRIAADAGRTYRAETSRLRGNKDLLWGEPLDAVNAILNAAYKDHIARTLPWADAGGRVLSSAGYFDYTAAMRAAVGALGPATDALAVAYGGMLAEAQLDAPYGLGDLFDPSQYPADGWALAEQFRLDVEYGPLPVASDFRVSLGDAEVARIQSEYAARFDARMAETVTDVVGRVRDVVGHMAEALRGYQEREDAGKGGRAGSFRDTLVSNVRDLVAILPSLNLTGDAVIADVCARMRDELCVDGPSTLRESAAARVRVVESAESIIETMSAYV